MDPLIATDPLDFETPVARYLRLEGISTYELARRVGISYKQLCAWRDGYAMPSLVNAAKLERVSGGKMAMMAWLATPMGRKQWEQKSDWDNWQSKRRAAYHRKRERGEFANGEVAATTAAPPSREPHEAVLVIPGAE